MNCERFSANIDAYMDDELEEADALQAERHVSECPVCERLLNRALNIRSRLRELPVPPPADGFADAVIARAIREGSRLAPTRRLVVAIAASVAFVAVSLAALIYTDFSLDLLGNRAANNLPSVDMALEERRTVNLVFASNSALNGVRLSVDLPAGVELAGYEGMRRVQWKTALQAGRNVLPLELQALYGRGGELTAYLRHGDDEKIFRINLSIAEG